MKKVLSLLLLSSSLLPMQLAYKINNPHSRMGQALNKITHNKPTIVDQSSVRAPLQWNDVQLCHTKQGFTVKHDNEKHVIEKHLMDKASWQ